MNKWRLTDKERYLQSDHSGHLWNYRRHRELLAAARAPAVRAAPVSWQCPTRPAYRNPTPAEDPAAYEYGFD